MKSQQVWRGAVLLSMACALLLPVMAVSAQSSGIGGRVVNPDPSNPRTQSIFIYTLKEGETKEDQLLVLNRTDQEQTILLGSVDGVVTNSGDYTCRQDAEPVEDSGGWVRLAKKEVTLPAGGEEKVDFTVTVPDGADVGEHNSCLTIQTAPSEEDDKAASGVRLRMRQAIRMIVTIPGELRRDLSISNFTINYGDNGQQYELTVANRGNVSADVDMGVRITSMFNQEVANVGDEYPVVPGESLTKKFSSELSPLLGGWYEATPTLRYDKRLGAFGTQNAQAQYETVTGTPQTMFFWPTTTGWMLIVAVLALFLSLLFLLVRRAKHHLRIKRSAREYTVKKGDTLQGLAEESHTGWKELARLNRLSAPYTLTEGQKMKLPHAEEVHTEQVAPVAHRTTRRARPSSSKKD